MPSTRTLNRTLLRRQLLDGRRRMPVSEVLEHLVGMQAQVPRAPYAGLLARLDGFAPEELEDLYERHEVVRINLMRATLHLVTKRDALRLRPVTQAVLDRTEMGRPDMRAALASVDREALRREALALLAEGPQAHADLKRELAARLPGADGEALARWVHFTLPVLQAPPRGLWSRTGQAKWVTVDDWLGEPVSNDDDPGPMIVRYLRAFGPATVADIAAWSRLTGVREHVERLELKTVGDRYLDVPDGELADEGAPAPPRFLGEFDNVLVAYKDRSRIIPDEHRDVVVRTLGTPMLLVDGFVRAMWRHDRGVLGVRVLDRLSAAEKKAVREEGKRLLALLAPRAKRPAVTFS